MKESITALERSIHDRWICFDPIANLLHFLLLLFGVGIAATASKGGEEK
jgi:hypothetical protein